MRATGRTFRLEPITISRSHSDLSLEESVVSEDSGQPVTSHLDIQSWK